MQRKRPTQVTDEWEAEEEAAEPKRRTARITVPVAVAGVAAVTIGLVPAFAGSGDPDLPKISAEELITKIATSDTQQMSGTVRIDTDLGLPSLPGLGGGGGLLGGASKSDDGKDGGATADPQAKLLELAAGSHTLRVSADGEDKHRLTVVDKSAEYSLVHNGAEVWAYDSATNSAYHATSPEGDRQAKPTPDRETGPEGATPQAFAQQVLKAVDDTTSVKVDGTAKVAGRDAYKLLIQPKQSGSTVGAIRIAVDAENGVPLKVTLSPKSGGKAVVDAGFTSVDFGRPDASTFEFTPPKGAEVKEQKDLGKERGKAAPGLDVPVTPSAGDLGGLSGLKAIGEGWASVVQLKAPDRAGAPSGRSGDDKGGMPPEAQKFMDSLGDKASGKFGSGTVFSTRLVNALLTDDGAVYVGAVDKATLVKAANEAK
ncbi:DUF2092 domain-containing protein [Streptomyces sp. NPDC004647]|uniref:LolA family protein n=1 Tax=Streptomyces sp. NPDC004647 TaxID=3154671 RepID=UPI0033B4B6D1